MHVRGERRHAEGAHELAPHTSCVPPPHSHCKTPLTSLVQARIHHDAKHDKLAFTESDYFDVHEAHGGVTTAGIAVRGTTNAEKLKKKADK